MNGGQTLTSADLQQFRRIDINRELLALAQVRRVTDHEARRDYGITFDGDLSGIVFPYLNPISGLRPTARLRRDNPETDSEGKPENKYVCPFGDNRHLYFPPGARDLLSDPSVPLIIVEAEKSALAVTALAARQKRRILAVATGGCWGWMGKTGIETGPNGERKETRGPLPDFRLLKLTGRTVLIAFDSNVASNPKVRAGRKALAEWLADRGAVVAFVTLPEQAGVNGPDDFVGQHGDEAMLVLIDAASPFRRVPGVLASEVKPEVVRWLWRGYIPMGKVCLFDGDPGLGKSTVTLDLAARVTQGWTMPDDTDSEIPASGVVIVSLEDGAGDTIRPRLEEAGADLSRVRIIQTILGDDGHERTPTIPVDLPAIELAIKDVEAGLLIIDPLFATLGADTNSHRDQDVRRALAPLASLAERTRVAVIAVRHLNKGSNPNPKYRGGGSIGIIGAARAALVFAKDPQDDAFFVMAPSKMNLCALPPALRYRLEAKGAVVAVVWEGASPHTAESLLAQPESDEETGAISDAKRFLRDVLAEGPREVKENKREARNLGVSVRTLGRAKALLRIEPRKVGFGEGQHWEWELTEGCQARPEECQSR